jgi:hypothetical protein
MKAKNAVLDGIRETANALSNGYIYISPDCKKWRWEAEGYVWNDKSQVDEPLKVNDHLMDSTRYFVNTMYIVRKALRREDVLYIPGSY